MKLLRASKLSFFISTSLAFADIESTMTPNSSTSTEKTNTTATIKVDLNKSLGQLFHTERYWTTIKNAKGQKDFALLKELKPAMIRTFNLGHTGPEAEQVKSLGAVPVVCATNLIAGKTECGKFEPNGFKSKLKSILIDAKKKHPGMIYVEIVNEPDMGQYLCKTDYPLAMRAALEVGDEINKSLDAGIPKLKIGGPVITGIDGTQQQYIPTLLDYLKANNLNMGFISYHQYVPNPKRHYDNAIKVAAMFKAREMPYIPHLNTEWNFDWQNPGDSKVNADALAYTAAYILAGHYYYTEATRELGVPVIPFAFCENDYVNAHRSLVIASQTSGTDGTITPHYNIRKMQSMMKDNRVSVEGLDLDNNGYGLGSMASIDATGVTVLLWNCFNECTNYTSGKCLSKSLMHKQTFEVTLEIPNIQSQQKTAKERIYLVDATHSNYGFNQSKQHLEQISTSDISLSGTITKSFTIAPNSVYMYKLELPLVVGIFDIKRNKNGHLKNLQGHLKGITLSPSNALSNGRSFRE